MSSWSEDSPQRLPGVYLSGSTIGAASAAPTATPVFVGYAERATAGTLYSIESLEDYQRQLGGAHGASMLFHGVWHYFANGGGACFVLAAGDRQALEAADPQGVAAQLLPHQVFLLAFLRMQETPRRLFNALPTAHRHLYYRDLLDLKERPSVPDQVAVWI